jgi:AcrR family transcriptional regulator
VRAGHLRLVEPLEELPRIPVSADLAAPVPQSGGPQRVRIADAAIRCISRTGVARTTLDDVAKEAGCSRATVYRAFPGGKEEVVAAAVETELARFFSSLAVEMGRAEDLEDAIVCGMVAAASCFATHPALGYVLENEPGVLLPHLCFAPMDRVLEAASRFVAPFLARWLDPEAARRVADWAARIVISYIASPAPGVNPCEMQSTRKLVNTFVMPGARALAEERATNDRRRR